MTKKQTMIGGTIMEKVVLKNRYGERVSGFPCLRKRKYGTGEFYSGDKRRPMVDYERWLVSSDENGFDVTKTNDKGQYIIEIELPVGTELIRYGSPEGRYTAPKGTKYEELSLPWDERTCEYHEYIVNEKNEKVICIVDMGSIAPGFEYKGGGIQYMHKLNIHESLKQGILKEV